MTDLPLPGVRELVAALRRVQEFWELDAISITQHLPTGPLTLHLVGLTNPILTVEDVHGSMLTVPEYLPSER